MKAVSETVAGIAAGVAFVAVVVRATAMFMTFYAVHSLAEKVSERLAV